MHRTTIIVSAPNIDKLNLCRNLAYEPSHIYFDKVNMMIEFTFEFPDEPDYLLEQTMERLDVVKLEEDPCFEGCEVECVKEYPCEA